MRCNLVYADRNVRKKQQEWFAKYLKLENGVPDESTYRRIMMKITPSKIHDLFVTWMKSVLPTVKGVVAIDGKQVRRTGGAKKRPVHVVSAFSQEFGLVFGTACL